MIGTVINTMRVFEVVAQVAPDPAFPGEIAAILDMPEQECLEILTGLTRGGWLRNTSDGFQTIGQRVFRLVETDHKTLDRSFIDRGHPVPSVIADV